MGEGKEVNHSHTNTQLVQFSLLYACTQDCCCIITLIEDQHELYVEIRESQF